MQKSYTETLIFPKAPFTTIVAEQNFDRASKMMIAVLYYSYGLAMIAQQNTKL